MQQTYRHVRNDTLTRAANPKEQAEDMLNVALVYQDMPTRQWVGRVRDRMAEMVGGDVIRCTEWKIGDLMRTERFADGLAALAAADAIVISLHAAERLPAVFYLWVNLWLLDRCGRPGALIALVGRPEEPNSGSVETRRYFHAVAAQGTLELFIQEGEPSGTPMEALEKDLLQWTQAA